MANNIKVNLPAAPRSGQIVTFPAVCDCASVTAGLIINGETYTVCDAMGNCVTGKGGAWCEGAQISVVLDCENKKAYIQNAAITPEGIGAIAEAAPVTTDCNIELTAGGNKFLVTRYTSDTLNSPCSEGLITDGVGLIFTYAYTPNYGRQLCLPGSMGALCMRYISGGTVSKWFDVLDARGGTMAGDLKFQKADNGYSVLMKNHSASADYGTQLQDYGADGDYVRLQLRAHNQGAKLAFSNSAGASEKVYDILHTGNLANMGVSKIQTGTYTGTGTYGETNPNSLTFDFEPKLVIVTRQGNYSGNQPVLFVRDSAFTVALNNNHLAMNLIWGDKSVSWYSHSTVELQANVAGRVYCYVAIG